METNSQQQQAEWELSKENIQPLKSGRKASKLAANDRQFLRTMLQF